VFTDSIGMEQKRKFVLKFPLAYTIEDRTTLRERFVYA